MIKYLITPIGIIILPLAFIMLGYVLGVGHKDRRKTREHKRRLAQLPTAGTQKRKSFNLLRFWV